MILLINPRSARWNHRAPLSLLTVATGLRDPYTIIDGNFDDGRYSAVRAALDREDVRYAGLTVMPGPQLTNAIRISRLIRELRPGVRIIWGGTFPAIYRETVIRSPLVDAVVSSQGEYALPEIIDAIERGGDLLSVRGVSSKGPDGTPRHHPARPWRSPDPRPFLPWESVPMERYLLRTFLGRRTTGYVSSIGCPFTCGFCSVVPMYEGAWLAQSPERTVAELAHLRKRYGVDSVEFFDDNFFVSEARVAEFCARVKPLGLAWWGEGRIDTILRFGDATLAAMRDAGLRMIFSGAESGSDDLLALLNKGGTQSSDAILAYARRLAGFGIVPELSFILGNPSDDVDASLEAEIAYLRRIREANPASEICFHTYSPVLMPGSAVYEAARARGFAFPATLEEWDDPRWESNGARKNGYTPWLAPRHRRRIRDVETVFHAYAPSIADVRMTPLRRRVLRAASAWRYRRGSYGHPLELRILLNRVFRYRQPAEEGARQVAA